MLDIKLTFFGQLYTFYRPYFGTEGEEKKRRSWHAAIIVIINAFQAILFAFSNAAINALFGVLEQPGVTYTAFFGQVGYVVFYLALGVITSLVKEHFISRLRESLVNAVDEDFLARWVKNNFFYTLKLNPQHKANIINEIPPQVMITYNPTVTNNAVKLLDDFINIVFRSLIAVWGLYSLSQPLVIPFFAASLTIPGYMAFVTLGYAITYNYLTRIVGNPLTDREKKIKKVERKLFQLGHHLVEFAESIALKLGALREESFFKVLLRHKNALKELAEKVRTRLNFINGLHFELGFLIPVILSAPNIIAGRMRSSAIFEVIPFFHVIVQLFSWKSENYDDVNYTEVSLGQINELNEIFNRWQPTMEHAAQAIVDIESSNNNKFEFKNINVNLSIKKPDSQEFSIEPLLRGVNLTLKRGQITRLAGSSGIGKSTLIRALARVWPYLDEGGRCIKPSNLKIHFIPTESFVFHQRSSLLDTILYPALSDEHLDKKHIETLMRKANLEEDIIDDMKNNKVDWKKRLSAGEKQRLMLIGAMLAKPDILFMDEATCNIDSKNKATMLTLLKEELPHCAICAIDHNALPGQYNKELNLTPLRNSDIKTVNSDPELSTKEQAANDNGRCRPPRTRAQRRVQN